MKKSFVLMAAVAAGAILPALGEDSAFARGTSATGRLDLRTGTQVATEGTAVSLTYSPRWGNAANCTVTETVGQSAPRMICNSSVEGGHAWSPKSGPGVYTLTHTAGDTTYAAQFLVRGDDTAFATNASATGRHGAA